MVNRLYEPASGQDLPDGTDIRQMKSHGTAPQIGYAASSSLPHMTVAQNIAVPKLGWSHKNPVPR